MMHCENAPVTEDIEVMEEATMVVEETEITAGEREMDSTWPERYEVHAGIACCNMNNTIHRDSEDYTQIVKIERHTN